MSTDTSIERIWDWIPNISGRSYDAPYIISQINKSRGTSKYSFESDSTGKNISASDANGSIAISIRDEGGICLLETESYSGDGMLKEIWIENVWKEFRRILDSCSNTICDCTAMDQPIKANESGAEQAIAFAFIDTMEEMSDSGTYLAGGKMDDPKRLAERMEDAIKMCDIANINHLYGLRFLDIYADRFEKDQVKEFQRIIDARRRKVEIVYEGMMHTSEVRFKELSAEFNTNSLDIAMKSLRVAKWMLVSSLIAAVVMPIAIHFLF